MNKNGGNKNSKWILNTQYAQFYHPIRNRILNQYLFGVFFAIHKNQLRLAGWLAKRERKKKIEMKRKICTKRIDRNVYFFDRC